MCGPFLVVASGYYLLAVVCELLIVVASLVEEHRLWDVQAQQLRHIGLVALWHEESWPPNQGSNRCPLHCKEDS